MRQFFVTIGLFVCLGIANAQTGEVAVDPNAKEILDKTSVFFSKKSGLDIDVLVSINNNQTGKTSSIKGQLQLKNQKFKLSLPDVVTYFDGKTEYVHLVKEKEVNVSSPKPDELKETNPVFLLQSYKNGYKMRYEGVHKEKGKNVDIVNLYPNDREKPFSIITIAIDKTTMLPVYILTKGKNGIDTRVDITGLSEKNMNDAIFVFDEKAHKDVELIDLR